MGRSRNLRAVSRWRRAGGRLLINRRAAGDPERLAEAVRESLALAMQGMRTTVEEFAHFRPGQPAPTHRVAEVAA
jgi:hypothetical protein